MAKVRVEHDYHPEDIAMMQALYSRSPAPVASHIEKVEKRGSGKFLERFYVGYGHKSIGDCGSTTIFVEGVSMLAAKAIQDNPLYSGQEASTRYIDFTRLEGESCINPFEKDNDYRFSSGEKIYAEWMTLYTTLVDLLNVEIKKRYPLSECNVKEGQWKRATEAKAFDIARGLLPIGTRTNLSWTTNLRQAADHIERLHSHPLHEVRTIAYSIAGALYEKYPHSFKEPKDWLLAPSSLTFEAIHFLNPKEIFSMFGLERSRVVRHVIDREKVLFLNNTNSAGLSEMLKPLADRGKYQEVPRFLERYGTITAAFSLDFGSFRDIQRHRNANIPIPIVCGEFGMHPWYIREIKKLLPDASVHEVLNACMQIASQIDDLRKTVVAMDNKNGSYQMMYFMPMAMQCICSVTASIPQHIYMSELRSSQTVHPTLRHVAQEIGQYVKKRFPEIPIFVNYEPTEFSIHRGKQTIEEKTER